MRLETELLSDNGFIFVSIGNDEVAQLKMLIDKVFGEIIKKNIIHRKKIKSLKMHQKQFLNLLSF